MKRRSTSLWPTSTSASARRRTPTRLFDRVTGTAGAAGARRRRPPLAILGLALRTVLDGLRGGRQAAGARWRAQMAVAALFALGAGMWRPRCRVVAPSGLGTCAPGAGASRRGCRRVTGHGRATDSRVARRWPATWAGCSAQLTALFRGGAGGLRSRCASSAARLRGLFAVGYGEHCAHAGITVGVTACVTVGDLRRLLRRNTARHSPDQSWAGPGIPFPRREAAPLAGLLFTGTPVDRAPGRAAAAVGPAALDGLSLGGRFALLCLAAFLALIVGVLVTRLVALRATRAALARRARLVPVPTTSFDAAPGELDAVAQVWARAATRTVGGWATRRAGAVRVLLAQDAASGKMVYALEVPEWARPTMALPAYREVQQRPAEEFRLRGDPAAAATRRWWWLLWR